MYCVKVFCLAYFTLPTVYKDYTHCSVLQCLMSLYGCTTSHCICTPQFMYLFIWYGCSLNALSPQNSCWNLSRPARNVTVYKNKSQHSSTEDKQTSLMWHRIWLMGMQGDRRCTHRVRSTRNGAWRNSPAWLLPLAGKLGSALCWQDDRHLSLKVVPRQSWLSLSAWELLMQSDVCYAPDCCFLIWPF